MTGSEIRKKFLNFFNSKGASIITSDSVVPKDDPTVLFTTAGMQQFKPQFLGKIDGYTSAATSQKCIRTDDLEEVGVTDFHHTFFEMLGNFSFGDYFKKEAINWAWEFLTKELNLPEDKLWVSVYEDDDEAYNIWIEDIKLDPKKIVRLGDKSNFWPSDAKKNGPNGPCGPCSEIFYDWGASAELGNENDDPGNDEHGRFCEVWNLVFTQFNRKDGGVLEPLPSKNIDTGMGLERLTAVMQGKKNNFETDLFAQILEAINQINSDLDLKSKRVIVDHIRGAVFAINDGVVPSNEGRGYVVRRLIIDMSDIILQSGIDQPVAYNLVDSVVDTMKDQYSELVDKALEIKETIKRVEQGYLKVAKERIPELEAKIDQCVSTNKTADDIGKLLFEFRDTYGLTFETIARVAQPKVNQQLWDGAIKAYDALMEQQKTRSRASSKMTGDVFTDDHSLVGIDQTNFVGYTEITCNATVLKLISDSNVVDSINKGDAATLILDQTPFYAESGGQVADIGFITKDDTVLQVIDVQKQDNVFKHEVVVDQGSLNVNDQVVASIDEDFRESVKKNHSATHLLQAALTNVLGDHVKQQGSLVDDQRLRFDFSHHKSISEDQINQIETEVNAKINDQITVNTEVLSLEEAKQKGARAYFAEKYGDTVRVVSMGDYSIEFCGGTHVDNIKQISKIKVVSQSAVAQGIRRIEAVTDNNVEKFLNSKIQEFLDRITAQQQKIDERLALLNDSDKPEIKPLVDNPTVEDAKSHLEQLAEITKKLNKKIEQQKFIKIKENLDDYIAQAQDADGYKTLVLSFEDVDMGVLRNLADLFKQKLQSVLLVLFAKSSDNVYLLIGATDDVIDKGVKANEIIKEIAPLIDGQGGGKPQLAQAGSKSPEKIEDAILKANQLLKERLAA